MDGLGRDCAPAGAAPKGNAEALRQKGPGPDDTPKRPDHRPPKVQPAPDGAGNLSGQDTGAQSNGFAPFFAAQKQEGTTLKEELRK